MPTPRPLPAKPARLRRTGTVALDGDWLQGQLDLRFVTLTAFAAEAGCDPVTLRKALEGRPISVRKAADIAQALRLLPVEQDDLLVNLLGRRQLSPR